MTDMQEKAKALAVDILAEAKSQGATAAEVGISESSGFSVNVRLGETETVEYNHDKGVGITVYFGQRKGSASTSDTQWESVQSSVRAACDIAKVTAEDKFSGLADKALMAKDIPDLDLCHPWGIDTEQGIELAKECEDHARAYDKRITNSEGASVSTHQGYSVYANSHGFVGAYPSSRHSLSCCLIAEDGHGMQRDYDFTTARDAHDLLSASTVAKSTAEKTLQRLNARRVKTQQAPVIFSADIASGLLSCFISAIRGSSLYRRSSFLVDHLDKQVFSNDINIYERPYLNKGLGSAPFDAEGVATQDRDIVSDGVLQGYVLSSYSARKLGMQTTGNAGGVHNLFINHSDKSLDELIKEMGTGLIATDVMGQGINIVTGDYSRGASGFWVENGEIQYPVEEITIAGNLKDMFQQIVAVGNDVDTRGNIQTGSIWLENMTVSGE